MALSKRMLTFVPDDESQKRFMARHQVFFDASFSRTRRLERSLVRTRLCRLPEQEPSKSSISQTAFIQRNPAISSKVTEKATFTYPLGTKTTQKRRNDSFYIINNVSLPLIYRHERAKTYICSGCTGKHQRAGHDEPQQSVGAFRTDSSR